MILNVDIPFEWFQIVYLVTDMQQRQCQVVGVKACPDNGVLIEISRDGLCSWHYPGELSADRIIQ